MSGNSTNRPGHDPLDRALASLPRDVAPSRDLWAGIRADIEVTAPAVAPAPVAAPSYRWMRLAAGFLLVIASSVTTYVITQQSAEEKIAQTRLQMEEQLKQAPEVNAMPVSFGGQGALGVEYQQAREALDAEFQRQVATLPPVTRAKLERNLADLRRAASEISATLAQHPNHPLLQELLLSTYQNELALLASVSHVSVPTLNQPETRL